MDQAQAPHRTREIERLATGDLLERLSRFEGPPEQFLLNLLAFQCHVSGAEGGAILRPNPQGRADVLSVYPPLSPGATAPVWLAQAVESAPSVLSAGTTATRGVHQPDSLYGQPANRHLVMIPLRSGGGVRGVGAFIVTARNDAALNACRERLELTISLLSLYEMRLTLQRRQVDLNRLRMAMETLAAVNEPDKFKGAAMAVCNEVAARWQCERVALGVLKGRYVKLVAMSHTEKFSRKMQLVQDLEGTMEECLDQDIEVVHPPGEDATYVSRAGGELARRHGPSTVVSLPMRQAGEPVAVLTCERPADREFLLEDIESLRLACELCTARLMNLYETDKWFGARAAASARKGLSTLLGPKHTWIKVAAIAILAGICFLAFVKGNYTVESPFTTEAIERQVVAAPFQGHISEVFVEPNDPVEAGVTELAALDTSDLELQLNAARHQRSEELKKYVNALDADKPVDAQIALAEAGRIKAQIDLLEHRIRQARIVSRIEGRVIGGDLKRQIGAPVDKGDVLFEVAPLANLRAELSVPEDRIADVQVGQEGELATASFPGRKIRFRVERVNPVAEVVESRNVFKVRVKLLDLRPDGEHSWLRPGMEGIAKVSVDRRPYGAIWTRSLVNWIRMKLWI